MNLPLYRMEFPLRYDLEADAIVDFNNEVIAELSGGCRGDMEYLVLAANEKHARDNVNAISALEQFLLESPNFKEDEN